MFIAFEGGEGAGKSTQEAVLAQWFTDRGRTVVRTREPGGTPAGEAMRHIVLSHDFDGLDERAEALLFAASRGEHVAQVILPALKRGDVVICDRYMDSSIAYQGIGRGLGEQQVRDINMWATNGLLPDLTIVLDVDPVIGLARAGEPDRLESAPLEYHQRVRQGFLDLAQQDPARYVVIAADQDPQTISELIIAAVSTRLDQV